MVFLEKTSKSTLYSFPLLKTKTFIPLHSGGCVVWICIYFHCSIRYLVQCPMYSVYYFLNFHITYRYLDTTCHMYLVYLSSMAYAYTVGEKKDWTKRDFRSKTTLITGSVYGTWVNPPFCKIATFFHRSLALSMPIWRNFQSNGVKWRSIKLWYQKFHITGY